MKFKQLLLRLHNREGVKMTEMMIVLKNNCDDGLSFETWISDLSVKMPRVTGDSIGVAKDIC